MEAKIDLSSLNKLKQNVFSVGEDISVWSTGNDGKYNVHFYYPNANDPYKHFLRFSTVIGEKPQGYNVTRRTKGVIRLPEDVYVIKIRFDGIGISINGNYIEKFGGNNKIADLLAAGDAGNYKFITEDDTPANTYSYFVTKCLESDIFKDLEFGSEEGSTRSWAYYEYIKYHKNL